MNFKNLIKNEVNSTKKTLFSSGSSGEIDKILNRSTRAVCGAFEREVVVAKSKVASTKLALKKAGYVIIGEGPAGQTTRKIWFNPAGVNL